MPNVDVVIETRGLGAIMRDIPDGSSIGGICRGIRATDWQSFRTIASQVASANESTISGGASNTASGGISTVGGGRNNLASGGISTISGGLFNQATDFATVVGGGQANEANGFASTVSGGSVNRANGAESAISGGRDNTAEAFRSTIAGGFSNMIAPTGSFSGTLAGQGLLLTVPHSSAVGRFNNPTPFLYAGQPFVGPGPFPPAMTASNRIFMVGFGTDPAIGGTRSNLFSVTADGNGHFAGSVVTFGGADFAEYFESENGEQIPVGTSVVPVPGIVKIRAARPGEIPFGVISTTAAYIANASEEWPGKYARNSHGRFIYEDYEETVEISETQSVQVKGVRKQLSPRYDPSKTYIPRSARPEWNIVGLLGNVKILKGQPTDPRWIQLKDDGDYDLYLVR